MAFNTEKCKVMHLGKNNLKQNYNMGGQNLPIPKEEKDLGAIITDDFKVSSQCASAGKKVFRY